MRSPVSEETGDFCAIKDPPGISTSLRGGQSPTWQSRGTKGTQKIDGIATPLTGLAMTRYFDKLKARSAFADRAFSIFLLTQNRYIC
jgi:hypothetical protein